MSHSDHDFHALRGVPVGEDPDVASRVVRRVVAESAAQGESMPARNDHRLIGFFMARSQLSFKIRVFGPTEAVREMNLRAAKTYWTALALAAYEDARR